MTIREWRPLFKFRKTEGAKIILYKYIREALSMETEELVNVYIN